MKSAGGVDDPLATGVLLIIFFGMPRNEEKATARTATPPENKEVDLSKDSDEQLATFLSYLSPCETTVSWAPLSESC